MLIHVIGVEQSCFLECAQQIFGERFNERLGFTTLGYTFHARGVGRLPSHEQFGRGFIESRELRVAEYGGLDVRASNLETAVAGALRLFEQCGAHGWEDLPIVFERVNVTIRDAAAQVGVNVLQVLRFGAVNVTREVKVEVVLLVADFGQRHHARVAGDVGQTREGVHDFVDVLGAEPVLVAVFDERFGSVNHEYALAGRSGFLVEHDDAGRDTRAVKQIRRQTNDALDVAALDDIFADGGLSAAAKQHAMRENDRTLAAAFERGKDVQQKGVVAIFLRRDAEGETTIEVVGRIEAVAPRLGGERGIGDGKIEGLERAVGLLEIRSGKRVVLPDFRRGAIVEDHVHPGERLGGVVHFLAVDGEVQPLRALGFVVGLEKQRTGTARGVVDGLAGAGRAADADDLGHDARNLRRGVKLALALARLGGEVAHQVFIGVAQKVIAFGAIAPEIKGWRVENGNQVGEAVHHVLALAELVGVIEVRNINHPLEVVRVSQFADDFVDLVADFFVALERDHIRKTAALGHIQQIILLAGGLVRHVFHEQQDQDVILVLRGVHAAAQLITTGPERAVQFRFLDGHGLTFDQRCCQFCSRSSDWCFSGLFGFRDDVPVPAKLHQKTCLACNASVTAGISQIS